MSFFIVYLEHTLFFVGVGLLYAFFIYKWYRER